MNYTRPTSSCTNQNGKRQCPLGQPAPFLREKQQQEKMGLASPNAHNLNIQNYSFDEILGLFDLSYDISIQDMKKAKNKVLMLHPDKSRLPADYFLFYKKALDIVAKYYENQHRQDRVLTKETATYVPLKTHDVNKATSQKVSSVIKDMSPREFQEKFNDLFEKNSLGNRPDPKRNEWFSNEDAVYDIKETVSQSNMAMVLEKIKDQNQGLIKYRGVQEMRHTGSGANFYDEGEGDDDAAEDVYISSDPFSKLKFDDLRKVHKDQTVFAVSEKDFQKVQTYASTEQFVRARGQQDLKPLEKSNAEKILLDQERVMKERMAKKQHEAVLRSQQYEEINRAVLSTFLQLENGGDVPKIQGSRSTF
jgi:hypothetical protein